ncbi:endonuclease/exonuclease/phosphatase family protein [Streptomyces avicenniae]|uniref:endonuclease/exonuclease/phosphatase family protein n=1 Tax=Streptomyces avicenniae TaxID=500153 RepID=UPI00069BEA30|nr:endonuclease/exonuclease/phosphatase family protein [Streptomyces avicenniae]
MIPMTPERAISPLTAVTTVAALETLRVAGTVTGTSMTGVLLLVCVAALGGPLVWWLGSRAALPLGLAAAAVARLVVQVPGARTSFVAAVAAGVALAGLVLVARRSSLGSVARAVALGVGADVALRLPLSGLDPVWRGGPAGWTVALLTVAALGAGAAHLRRHPVPVPAEPVGDAGLALLGPALALYGPLLGSPALLAARAGVPWDTAGLWIAAGTGLAVLALTRPLPAGERWVSPAVATGGVAVVLLVPSWPAGPGVLLAVAALPLVLRRALRLPLPSAVPVPLGGTALAGAGAALGYALVALPSGLGAPHIALALLAVACLGAAAVVLARSEPTAPAALPGAFRSVVLAALFLALPPLAGALRAAPEPLPTDTAGGMYRLMTWNVHHAVDRDGRLDPEAVLDVVRDSGAHVVVLQEVPRGLATAGGLDLRTWLERRLDLSTVWAPAADRTTGNLLLTGLPVLDAVTGELPGGDRSAATVDLRLTDGETARVVTAHTGPDLPQHEALLRAVDGDPHAVLAGDLNAEPGSPGIDAYLAAGLHSAQDGAEDLADRDTAVSPPRRVDWILGGQDVTFGDVRLTDTDASDHLPLTATVYLD